MDLGSMGGTLEKCIPRPSLDPPDICPRVPSNAAHSFPSNNFPPTRQTASPRAWLKSQIHGVGTAPLSVAGHAASRLKMRTQTLLSPACEMETSQHVGTVAELDLSICQPNTLVDRINAVPGLKTSAGKLEFFFILSPTFFTRPTVRPFFEAQLLHEIPTNSKGGAGHRRNTSIPPSVASSNHTSKPLLTHLGQLF